MCFKLTGDDSRNTQKKIRIWHFRCFFICYIILVFFPVKRKNFSILQGKIRGGYIMMKILLIKELGWISIQRFINQLACFITSFLHRTSKRCLTMAYEDWPWHLRLPLQVIHSSKANTAHNWYVEVKVSVQTWNTRVWLSCTGLRALSAFQFNSCHRVALGADESYKTSFCCL
jgi:hypothetical protein